MLNSFFNLKLLTPILLLPFLTGSAVLPKAMSEPVEVVEVVEEPVVETVTRYTLPGGSNTELLILDALQGRGITDRNALAVVLGNIKQESKFTTNICEGGARVSYWGCRSGGYGLIQWTTADRYRGLGDHARRMGLNPSYAPAQISFIFAERQWRSIEQSLKREGGSIDHYMNRAYTWLGWGIHGNRTKYAYEYNSRMVETTITIPTKNEG